MNFYDLDMEYKDKTFDTIIFGSSFMLMPDQSKAIEIAKSKYSSIQSTCPETEKFTFY